jgi:hypothetical protein
MAAWPPLTLSKSGVGAVFVTFPLSGAQQFEGDDEA